MRTSLQRWLWLVIVLPACTVFAAEPEQGLPQYAVKIDRWGSFITNSMVVSWVVAIGLIIFARAATRDMKDIPGGAQNLLEWLVEGLYGFLESIIGPHLVKRTFWFLATIFIFILSANWLGLIPGVGTIGWGQQTPHGFVVDQPLFRGANADLNLTFAMALIFFACWIVWALQELGPIGFAKELFGPKGDTTGFLRVLMIVVFFASGCLEIVSILFRPISLGFRLYGNIFAGENMLETMARLAPGLRLVAAHSVLLLGIAGGFGAGARFHVVVRCIHAADLSTRGSGAREQNSRLNNEVRQLDRVQSREPARNQRKVQTMSIPILAAELSGNLHVGLAAFGAAIGVGLIGMEASEAVGRNPGASTKIMVQAILAIAFAEAIVFYALFLVKQ